VQGHKTCEYKVSQLARYIGVAFQNPNSQFFKLTVWDEIVVGARALGCYDETWIRELVSLFRLDPLLKRAPYRLSEGEKKRVAFAAALSAKPAILALDEPTAGQDMFFRLALGRLLKNLRSRGQAILIVTQDLAFAEQHAHRWLMMAGGKIIADGSPRDVMADTGAMRKAGLRPTDSFQLCSLMKKQK
jgi:energy-coupling factor transport system ATP-binding protein